MTESILVFDRGHMEPTVWGKVEVGNIVRDQRDMLHTVVFLSHDTVGLKPVRGAERSIAMIRPANDRPVDVYVPSESECLTLLDKELGARLLVRVEEREHTLAQAPRFRVDPVPRNVEALKDHCSWMHGVELQDQLNQYNLAKKKRDKQGKEDALDEMVRAHDEFHADQALWPQPIPHHHAKEAS